MRRNITFYTLRPAIAMIELIFAIVVMGIVVMSAPMLLSTATNSGVVVIQQEAISEASSQMNIIMGQHWDENNITGRDFAVLYTTNGDPDLNATAVTLSSSKPRRIGTSPTSARIFLSESGKRYNASTIIGPDGGDRDDIDDFNGDTHRLRFEEDAGTIDYLERGSVLLTSTVSYISDTESNGTYQNPGNNNTLNFDLNTTAMGAAQSTNIKHIQVTLTSDNPSADLNKSITLHAFSCNIGNYRLEER